MRGQNWRESHRVVRERKGRGEETEGGFSCTYFKPASISTAELKFPRFQQVVARRRTHDRTAFLSS